MSKVVKVSVNLPQEDVDTLKMIAEERRLTVTQVLRQAIASEKFLFDQLNAGNKVLIQSSEDNSIREVIFK